MAKATHILLATAAILPLFWFTVAPKGQEICSSNIRFGGTNVAASTAAKVAFCKTVASYPL